jgi:hypothetical protein
LDVAVVAVCLILAAVILWAVGDLLRQLLGASGGPWATSIGLGLAAIVFVGGILNLLHLAYGPVLWSLVGAAALLAAVRIRRFPIIGLGRKSQLETAAAALLIAAVLWFTIHTQLPLKVFNFQDDFEKYFAYPVRMLATGTLASSPLSSLGSETLGGQAFLQGYVLSIWPITYISAVDSIFGLFLLMILAASAGWARLRWLPGAVLGALLVSLINPQSVNISALYLGAALMATAVMFTADDREHGRPSPELLGLVYAALVALKPIFVFFAACHLALCLPSIYAELHTSRKTLLWVARAALSLALGLLPWLALYAPNYLSHGMFTGQPAPAGPRGELNLLSNHTLLYGSSYLDYTALVILAGVVAILGLASWRAASTQTSRRVSLGIFGAAATGVLSYLVLIVYGGPLLSGHETSLRFAVPFVLGTCVVSIVMTPGLASKLPRAFSSVVLPVSTLIAVLAFLPSAIARYRQALTLHSAIAFNPVPRDPSYISYNEYWLSPEAKEYIRGFQDKVPAGEPLLAWINTPFLLDYKRNPIVDVDAAAIGSPWAHVPSGVRYVLWQYKGFGVRTTADYAYQMAGEGARERSIAARALAFGNLLSRLSSNADVIASDDKFVVFRILASAN